MNDIELMKKVHESQRRELKHQQKLQLEAMAKRPPFVKADSMWLVMYQCLPDVIRVSRHGDGFFAPGQSPCWGFEGVQEWIQEIKIPEEKKATSDASEILHRRYYEGKPERLAQLKNLREKIPPNY